MEIVWMEMEMPCASPAGPACPRRIGGVTMLRQTRTDPANDADDPTLDAGRRAPGPPSRARPLRRAPAPARSRDARLPGPGRALPVRAGHAARHPLPGG